MSIRSRSIQALLVAAMLAVAGPSYGLEFPQTRDRGAPARGPALGTRGEICLDPQSRPSLTSLLPHNAIATAFGADTDIPLSLWFYIPETGAAAAELTIVNELGENVYQQPVELPATPGTIQVILPRHQADDVTPAFQAGSLYYWDFALICDPDDRGDDVLLGGGIQRLDASSELLASLEAVADNPLAQAELYAAAGAWQEAIALAADLRSQHPTAWFELLSSVDLAAVADQPIWAQAGAAANVAPASTAPTAPASSDPSGSVPSDSTPSDSDPLESAPAAPAGANEGRSSNLQRLLEGIKGRTE